MADWYHNGCADAQVVAIAARTRTHADMLAAEFNIPRVFDDWRELVASPEVDAVCVTTPNYLHCEMTTAALRAGKHVLVEKPLAMNLREADEMITAAKEANVLLMVQQSQRFFPVHEVAKQIVDSGVIGDILSVRARWSHSGPEYWSPEGKWFFEKDKAGDGALFDLGIHKLDLIRYLTAKEAKEVSAFTATLAKDIEVEDYGVAMLRFDDGALGVVEASWASVPNENSIKLYGTRGNLQVGLDSAHPISVEFDETPSTAASASLPFRSTSAQDAVLSRGTWQGARFIPDVPKQSITGGMFRHFVDCIVNGRECIASGADNRKSLEVCLAAFESAETGRVVRILRKDS
jgi:predicted dehydrogenase